MEKDKHTTDVIFRIFKEGDVIAMFPGLPGTNDVSTCMSYQHIGQHGSASIWLSRCVRLATPEEYASLKRELESLGYNLRVVKRATPKHWAERRKQIAGVK